MNGIFTDLKLICLASVCLLLTSACAPVGKSPVVDRPATGTFTLFLQPLPQEANRLSFSMEHLAALTAEGKEVALPLRESRFVADGMMPGQKKLVNLTLPPGHYRGIAFRIAGAEVTTDEGAMHLEPKPEQVRVLFPFLVEEGRAETLFLSLSETRLVTDGVFFTPTFSLWKPQRLLTNLKGFVSNGGSQSLTVFNKRSAEVVSLLRVGKNPAGMVLDQQRNWLYVALTGENAISAIEINNDSILGRVPLRFGDQPTELVLTGDGSTLLALNRGSSSLSLIDTATLSETGRLSLPAEPYGLFLDPQGMRAFVTHRGTNGLTVVDLPSLQIRQTLSLDYSPLDGVADADGRQLYLLSDFSAEVMVVDVPSMTMKERIFVGNGAVSIKMDPASGLLYVGKQDGEIAVVDPRALIAIDDIPVGSRVQDMAIDNEENALFVLQPERDQLVKIDLVSKKVLGRLDIESGGDRVVVMGGR